MLLDDLKDQNDTLDAKFISQNLPEKSRKYWLAKFTTITAHKVLYGVRKFLKGAHGGVYARSHWTQITRKIK